MAAVLRQRYGAWLAFAAGLPVPLAFSPFDFYLLLPVLLAVLLWLIDDAAARAAARRGWLFGFAAFLTGTYWLYVSIHVFGNAPLALALLLMAALMAFMACYTALVCYVVVRFVPAGPLRWLAAFPACWVLAEWLRGWFLSGFPWLSLGYSATNNVLSGWIPLGGIFAASAAVALTAGGVRALVGSSVRTRIVAMAVVIAAWLGGWLVQQVAWTDAGDDTLTISIVQGSVPQDRKWLPEELVPTMQLYRDLTRQHWDSDLVIWPEAAIPALRVSLVDYYAKLAAEGEVHGTDIITGTIEYDPATNQYYNGVMALRGAQNIYHKRHLVPFGEYFPVPGFVREWLRLRNLPYSDYASGGNDQRPLQVAGQKIAPSICYEDVFGNEQRLMLPAATLLVNVSNDAWFGTSIAPHQHMQIARARAIETGRYLLRATNTGVSAVIAPDGRIEQTIPQFETRVMTAVVRPHTGATPYVVVGDTAIVLLASLAFVLVLARTRL